MHELICRLNLLSEDILTCVDIYKNACHDFIDDKGRQLRCQHCQHIILVNSHVHVHSVVYRILLLTEQAEDFKR